MRSQHLDDSDWKSFSLSEGVQRGQQRDRGTGTGLRGTVSAPVSVSAGLAELDPLTDSIRSGREIFHWREGAALRRTTTCRTFFLFFKSKISPGLS